MIRTCFAPDCDTEIAPHMPFCATHMKNDWQSAEVSA